MHGPSRPAPHPTPNADRRALAILLAAAGTGSVVGAAVLGVGGLGTRGGVVLLAFIGPLLLGLAAGVGAGHLPAGTAYRSLAVVLAA